MTTVSSRTKPAGHPRGSAVAGWWRDRSLDVSCGVGISLVVSGVAFLLSRTSIDNYDGLIMGQVATGVVDRHSIIVLFDAYHLNTPHSFYGIGMSLLMIPGILVAKVLGMSEAAGIMLTNSWLLGLLTGAAFVWCRLRDCSLKVSAVVSLVVGLGAGMLPFASTGFAEVALATATIVGMIGLSATSLRWAWGPLVIGAAAGAAIVVRDDSALLVAPWLIGGGLLLGPSGWRLGVLVRMVLGGFPFLALWTWYNAARYGLPWNFGYGGVLRFNHSFLAGVYGLVLSPGKGLILYVPVVVVTVCGLPAAWRPERVITAVAVLLVLSRIVFFAPYWGWYAGGGFGPRYVLPAVPALGIGLMEVARRFRQSGLVLQFVTVALVGLSIFIGLVGGAVDYQADSLYTALGSEAAFHKPTTTTHEFLTLYEAKLSQSIVDHHMFAWSEFPITGESSDFFQRRDIVSDALKRPSDNVRGIGSVCLVALGSIALFTGHRRSRRSIT